MRARKKQEELKDNTVLQTQHVTVRIEALGLDAWALTIVTDGVRWIEKLTTTQLRAAADRMLNATEDE